MKIVLAIDCMKKLPDGVIPALEPELFKRLYKQFDGCQLTIKRTGNDVLTVFSGGKKKFEHILHEAWESVDEWFINRENFTGTVSKSIAVCVPLVVPDYFSQRQ